MVFNKKAISPVVATALLLVVAVVAVVGFQTWFQTYQSSLNVKVEQESDAGTAITIERLDVTSTPDLLYLKNSGSDNVEVSSVSIGGATCTAGTLGSVFNVTPGVAGYNFTAGCNATKGNDYDIVVVAESGVFQETEIAR